MSLINKRSSHGRRAYMNRGMERRSYEYPECNPCNPDYEINSHNEGPVKVVLQEIKIWVDRALDESEENYVQMMSCSELITEVSNLIQTLEDPENKGRD